MRSVIQRVERASVSVGGEIIGEIGAGLLVLLGVGQGDSPATADSMIEKIRKLRIFPDEQGKTNLSVTDINGELLVVSQFTLYADCRKGNRPSFTGAGSPQLAEELYDYFVSASEGKFKKVAHGSFGASMKVSLVNDGPFTVTVEM
jgi:D-tyrosyl-tRNA(Tyr) deacylase